MKKICIVIFFVVLIGTCVFFAFPEISFENQTIDRFKPRTFFLDSRIASMEGSAKVTHVVDGDTIDVALESGGKKRVRIIGIDTPETVDPRKRVQCYGHEASARMKELLSDKNVTLKPKPDEDMDTYGRLLRYVLLDGVDMGAVMLKEGYAVSLCTAFPHPKCALYDELERLAKKGRVGKWGACL